MKKILCLLGVGMLAISCCDHQCYISREIRTLRPPLIVSAKQCNDWGCSVLVKDSTGRYLMMGNNSAEGRVIGASYNIGDTLK